MRFYLKHFHLGCDVYYESISTVPYGTLKINTLFGGSMPGITRQVAIKKTNKQDKAKKGMRGEARKQAILFAAIALIADEGAHNLSMASVASRAKASKETLYRHFHDRNGLLIELLRYFSVANQSACPVAQSSETFFDGLKRLGVWYLTMAVRPETLSFYRFVVGLVEESPVLGEAFTLQITQPILEIFEDLLTTHAIPGNHKMLAQQYLGLIQGKLWNRALVEANFVVSKTDIATQVEAGAKLMNIALSVN